MSTGILGCLQFLHCARCRPILKRSQLVVDVVHVEIYILVVYRLKLELYQQR